MFNACYDFPAFSGYAFSFFWIANQKFASVFVCGSIMALSYLCSISRFLGAFIMDSPSRYYVILLYIVILNGGKGVSLLIGESFLDT